METEPTAKNAEFKNLVKPLIYEKICQIMKAVDAIEKGRKNQQQGYAFRGIDDVYNAMHGPLAEHGVFIVPSVLSRETREQPTKTGGILFYTILTVAHRFYASDGSFIEATTCGEAMDTGDKSTNKAMSAAMKYAILEVFAMPTEGDNDTENHSHEVAPREPARTPPARPAPPKAPTGPAKPNSAPQGQGTRPPARPAAPPPPPAGGTGEQGQNEPPNDLSISIIECPTDLKKAAAKPGAKYKFRWSFDSAQAGFALKTFSDIFGAQLEAASKSGAELNICYEQGEYQGQPEGKIVSIGPA